VFIWTLDHVGAADSIRYMTAKPLPCPFCGSEAVCRFDGPETKPFYVRCERIGCPAHNSTQTFAEGDVAMRRWNQRVQIPPANTEFIANVSGFASRDLIRGELICIELDRTGVLLSDKIAFSPWSTPLMKRPESN
jgi:hypothetical protein